MSYSVFSPRKPTASSRLSIEKAMPVILTTTKEFDLWLEGETVEALKLQRPMPDRMLDIVARGREGRSADRGSGALSDGEKPGERNESDQRVNNA